jgi:hypothetical protein
MVSATTYSMIEFMKLAQVKLVYYCRDDPYWVISRYIFIYSLWKKDDSVGIVRTIMYLCHIIKFSMSKGTKSFGHDKALACESRGFVCKKRGCVVLTHPHALSENGIMNPIPLTGRDAIHLWFVV